MDVIKSLQTLSITSALSLSGVYLANSTLVLPCLYDLPHATSTAVFNQFYHRGAALVVPMSIISGLAAGAVAYLLPEQRMLHALAAGSVLMVGPWTALVLASTNNRLIEMSTNATLREKAGGEVLGLLRYWYAMNFARVGFAGVAGVVVLYAVLQGRAEGLEVGGKNL